MAFPYALVGRLGADQPSRPMRSHHSATVRSGSQLLSSQARTSDRISSVLASSALAVSVIAVPPGSWPETNVRPPWRPLCGCSKERDGYRLGNWRPDQLLGLSQ